MQQSLALLPHPAFCYNAPPLKRTCYILLAVTSAATVLTFFFWPRAFPFAATPLVALAWYAFRKPASIAHIPSLPQPTPPGFCPNCGYDLRATPDRCPECGTLPPKNEK